MVLSAASAFVSYVMREGDQKKSLLEAFDAVSQELDGINSQVTGKDFELAEEV
jgi:hypothetical protein